MSRIETQVEAVSLNDLQPGLWHIVARTVPVDRSIGWAWTWDGDVRATTGMYQRMIEDGLLISVQRRERDHGLTLLATRAKPPYRPFREGWGGWGLGADGNARKRPHRRRFRAIEAPE